MSPRRSYSPEQKAAALARVLAGEPVAAVARDMAIERTALQNWLSRNSDTVTAVVTPGGEASLQTLLNGFLTETLHTLTDHAKHYRSPEFIAATPVETLLAIDRQLSSRFVSIMDRLDGRTANDDAD